MSGAWSKSQWRLAPCGTPAAARRHYRRGEQPCQACLLANRISQRERKGADPWTTAPTDLPDFRPVRNGIPWRPYVYRGLGYDTLTPHLDGTP